MIQNFDIYILVNEDDWCILWNTGAFNKTKTKKLIDFEAPLCNTIWKSCLSISCAFVLI